MTRAGGIAAGRGPMRRRTLPRIAWRAVWHEPRLFWRLVVWSVVEAGPALFVGQAIARAVTAFAGGRAAGGCLWLALLAAVWVAAAIGAQRVILVVARIVEPFRDRLLGQVIGQAMRAERPDPGVAGRANLQVEMARDAFAAVITVVRSFAFTVVSVLVGLVTLLPVVALFVLPPFLLGLGCFLCSLPALARRQRAVLLADEATAAVLAETAEGLRDVAACRAEERAAEWIRQAVDAQAAATASLARVTGLRTAALGLGGWAPILAVLGGTPWLLRHGADAGAIVGTLAYLTQSLTPALNGLVEGLGLSGVRLAVTLDRLIPRELPRAAGRERVAGPVRARLREVTFSYGSHAAPLLEGLSLTLEPGDHLAVIGPSGIGKSTLAGLLSGTLVPDHGEVLIGGVPAARAEVAARVLIPQEAYVFQGTLRENLLYYAAADDRTVHGAAEAVGLALPDGLDAPIDPRRLSAGERQLIALTRAYLAPSRLVVLDEATCHLDPVAEARAERAFIDRDGILVVIAHRAASALRAPRVLLMDGRGAFLGTHEELRATVPRYAELLGDQRAPTP